MTATAPAPDTELGQAVLDVAKPSDDDLRLWSVTTLLGVLEKPGLLYWAAEQAARAAIEQTATWQAMEQDTGTDAAIKWLRDARFRRPKDRLSDAEFGTQMHALVEEYALTGVKPTPTRETFKGDLDAAHACLARFDEWLAEFQPEYTATEVVVYSPTYGYAGTADAFMRLDGVPLIADYKSSKKSYDAKGNPSPIYPETALQLALYRHADMAAVWRARRFERWRRRYYLLSDSEQSHAVPVPAVDGGVGIKITPEHCLAYGVRCDEEVHTAALYVLECARWTFETSKTVIGDVLTAGAR